MTAFFIALSLSGPAYAAAKTPPPVRLTVADFDKGGLINNLGGPSGTWELNPSDTEQSCKAAVDSAQSRKKDGKCLRIDYDVDSSKKAVNGFWTQLMSLDASRYDHLEFYVKGDKEKGYTTTFKIEIKKLKERTEGEEENGDLKGNFIITGVSDNWQKVTIPLRRIVGIEQARRGWDKLREFVVSFESRRADKKTGTIYIDDISFLKTGRPGPSIWDEVPRKSKTTKPMAEAEYARFLIKRLKGFPETLSVKKEFPEKNYDFLMTLAKDTWKYFDKIIDAEYGLPLDHIRLGEKSVIDKRTFVGDYTNVTNIGLYIMCVISAHDFGFISRSDAVKRIGLTLDSIEKLETYRGFLYNYYDLTAFQRTTNFISFVDSGWLTAGLVVAKNAFPEELETRCQALIDGRDFSFFYDPVEGHMHHGYYVNVGGYSEYHYGIFYSEPRAVSYIAIGKGDVPVEHWFMLRRTFPEDWGWQTQMPRKRKVKEYLGYKVTGGYYTYNGDGDKFVPSWGGSLFEALMPTMIIDEKNLAAKGLGANDKIHARIHMDYALNKLGYKVWGMSPSSVPNAGYSEYGVRLLGMKGYKSGVVTPHAAFLALEFIPEEAVKNLRTLASEYDIYGEYGFYDAVDPKTGVVARKYLCLDQAMSFISLNNFLNDGAIRKRFHKDKLNREAEKLLTVEDFFN